MYSGGKDDQLEHKKPCERSIPRVLQTHRGGVPASPGEKGTGKERCQDKHQ